MLLIVSAYTSNLFKCKLQAVLIPGENQTVSSSWSANKKNWRGLMNGWVKAQSTKNGWVALSRSAAGNDRWKIYIYE